LPLAHPHFKHLPIPRFPLVCQNSQASHIETLSLYVCSLTATKPVFAHLATEALADLIFVRVLGCDNKASLTLSFTSSLVIYGATHSLFSFI